MSKFALTFSLFALLSTTEAMFLDGTRDSSANSNCSLPAIMMDGGSISDGGYPPPPPPPPPPPRM